MLICGALPPEEYPRLRQVKDFTDAELRLLSSWQDPPPWGSATLAISFEMAHCSRWMVTLAKLLRNMPSNQTPLTDLGPAHFLGFAGGLYPLGENTPPTVYAEVGAAVDGGCAQQPDALRRLGHDIDDPPDSATARRALRELEGKP